MALFAFAGGASGDADVFGDIEEIFGHARCVDGAGVVKEAFAGLGAGAGFAGFWVGFGQFEAEEAVGLGEVSVAEGVNGGAVADDAGFVFAGAGGLIEVFAFETAGVRVFLAGAI